MRRSMRRSLGVLTRQIVIERRIMMVGRIMMVRQFMMYMNREGRERRRQQAQDRKAAGDLAWFGASGHHRSGVYTSD